jgi:hypothetical protein
MWLLPKLLLIHSENYEEIIALKEFWKIQIVTIDQIKTNQLFRLPFDIWVFTHTRQGYGRYSRRYVQN